jgi:hypothetical protein
VTVVTAVTAMIARRVRGLRTAGHAGQPAGGPVAVLSGDRDPAVGRHLADDHVTVQIGAVHARPVGPGETQGAGGRVTVGVAAAHRDDRDARAHRRVETDGLIRRAVVRDLEHLGAQFGAVAAGQQQPLDRLLDIAGEQGGQRGGRVTVRGVHANGQHDRGVVRPGSLAAALIRVRAGRLHLGQLRGVRPQRVPADPAGPAALVGPDPAHRHARRGGLRAHPAGPGGRLVDQRGLDRADFPPGQQTGQTADVVLVEVRQHDQRERGDPEAAQAGVLKVRPRAGVHGDGARGAGVEQEGVALAHVAHGHGPVVRRPRGRRGLPYQSHDSRDQHTDERQRTEPEHGPPTRGIHRAWTRALPSGAPVRLLAPPSATILSHIYTKPILSRLPRLCGVEPPGQPARRRRSRAANRQARR